jgi:hypothetical protein
MSTITSAVLSNCGHTAHRQWEQVRGIENECEAERRLAEHAIEAGVDMRAWWDAWFERSDEWREENGFFSS